ncbi:MAG: 50S ribosomal protein L19 [Candidatus Pacebacteria bacterium]|nr:50S ribosomal protein L19 [Candidatus Paceibacterota bacterium]
MNQAAGQEGVKISPVNMDNRKEIGIRVGDSVRVWQKIEEKGKTRLQAFEGLVLARKHGDEPGATFTVRRVSSGVGVEKIFPLYSPMIDKIEIVKRSKVRRAKLYHIREKVAREIKRQMRKMQLVDITSKSETEEAAAAEAAVKAAEEAEAAKVAEAEAAAKAAEEAKAAEVVAETEEAPAEEEKKEEAPAEEPAPAETPTEEDKKSE